MINCKPKCPQFEKFLVYMICKVNNHWLVCCTGIFYVDANQIDGKVYIILTLIFCIEIYGMIVIPFSSATDSHLIQGDNASYDMFTYLSFI